MNKLKLTFVTLFFVQVIVAQNLSPTVVNSSGRVIQNTSYSLEWSLGELAVSSLTNSNNLLTQGFLQPERQTVPIKDIFDESRFWAFPNPVTAQLYLQTDIPEIAVILIHDVSGRLVLQTDFQQHINLLHLNSGIYVVSLFNNQTQHLHSFKINKI